MTAVVKYLVDLVRQVADVPLIDELTEVDLGTPRATASIARAALRWLQDGHPEAIREQLEREVREADFFIAHRLRQASLDVAAGYPPPGNDLPIRLRKYEGRVAWFERNAEKFRNDHPPRPWTPAELGQEL